MDNPGEITRLCRLCLVKDEVNIPIFDEQNDIRQIFLKISSCLPVKVSRDDKLPKKICDGCSCKLDLLYEFWNTSANSEKTLLSWLGQAGVKKTDADHKLSAVVQQVANKPETLVKQEAVDPNDGHPPQQASDDSMLLNFQEKFSYEEDTDAGPSETTTKDETEAPPPKRARRTAAVKAQINITAESDDDEDMDNIEPMTKVEDESEESEGEDQEPSFADVPGTSTDDQPGPSGVGKDASLEAPKTMIVTDLPMIKWQCSACEKKFSQLMHLKTHMESGCPSLPKKAQPKQAAKKKPPPKKSNSKSSEKCFWPCDECPQIFSSSDHLETHRLAHLEGSQEFAKKINKPSYKFDKNLDLYTCLKCLIYFNDKSELMEHLENHPVFCCEVCQSTFQTAISLGIHSALHDSEGRMNCPFCTFTCEKKNVLITHLHCGHSKKDYACVVCEKSFFSPINLYSHQIRKHRVDITENSYMGEHLLKVPSATEPRKYLCDICGKEFTTRYRLERHIRAMHEGLKPYACQFCDRTFTGKDTMKKHERIHTGEKPYSCEFCGRRFRQDGPFKVHLRTHTGERPYVCYFCKKGFITNQCLKQHRNNCTENFLVS